MAEAFFNQNVPQGFEASSAGNKPAKKVHPVVVQAMREAGIDISRNRPESLTPEMIERAERIITMGCGSDFCPASFLPKVEDWDVEDPADKSIDIVRKIRDEIRERVDRLIDEIPA